MIKYVLLTKFHVSLLIKYWLITLIKAKMKLFKNKNIREHIILLEFYI
jgi:hypothetical protein